ncbi:MAG: hypothetical protein HY329_07255 [Chloroflexi bacterium]|nr:hypothetical protein [Chloroflexota bacterium]
MLWLKSATTSEGETFMLVCGDSEAPARVELTADLAGPLQRLLRSDRPQDVAAMSQLDYTISMMLSLIPSRRTPLAVRQIVEAVAGRDSRQPFRRPYRALFDASSQGWATEAV